MHFALCWKDSHTENDSKIGRIEEVYFQKGKYSSQLHIVGKARWELVVMQGFENIVGQHAISSV